VEGVALELRDASQVGEARRLAAVMASRLGMIEEDRGRVALVINEAAGNLLKHGGGGQVVITPLERAQVGLEMLFLDKGAGVDDVERAMRDGYSTAGTGGGGLGGIARMSDAFDSRA
jgi:anti-sigma regulatory factor (Ser/Thr protein kinase)